MVRCALGEIFGSRAIRVDQMWIDSRSDLARAFDEAYRRSKPDAVILAGGRSAGIGENLRVPYDLMIENLLVATHGIQAAVDVGVERLAYLGSSCVYPVNAPIPIPESALLDSPMEASSEFYAVAKLAGMKLCEAVGKQISRPFFGVVPATLFGPGDHFNTDSSHVIPSLLTRFHHAKKQGLPEVVVWGSGAPERDFIFSNDLAEALIFLLENYTASSPVNVSSSAGVSIRCLAELIGEVVGFRGNVRFDASKPDGAPRKVLDGSKLKELGWAKATALQAGLEHTYQWALREGVLNG